jgi:phosphoribosylformylglycinamidine cyclo-ligase
LLAPTKIYVKALKSVKNAGVNIKGCSHITGGGFYENIPRMFPDGIGARIRLDSYEVPPVFDMIQKDGRIEKEMMYNTYNMGIGMMLSLDGADVDRTVKAIEEAGEKAFVVGETIASDKKEIVLC